MATVFLKTTAFCGLGGALINSGLEARAYYLKCGHHHPTVFGRTMESVCQGMIRGGPQGWFGGILWPVSIPIMIGGLLWPVVVIKK